jgi:Tfp pilus assembly protein PilN
MSSFNFSRAPFVNERAPRLVFGLALVLTAALTATHGYLLTRYLLREQEDLDVRVNAIRGEIQKTDEALAQNQTSLARDQTALGDERTGFLVRLYRQKSFSWTGLFNELEAITPASVRVTSIAPAEEKGEIMVTLTVVGRTLQDILEMVRALESSSFFATVFPVDEANLDENLGQGTGVAATLKLQYVEGARERGDADAPVPKEPQQTEPKAETDAETEPDAEPETVPEPGAHDAAKKNEAPR